jgi:hypothetical protein
MESTAMDNNIYFLPFSLAFPEAWLSCCNDNALYFGDL